uniref:Polyprotein n=1 Tax=Oryza sativa subsp. japonica TaxID=39947 RepID=Q8S6U9_ORYSJ|nr:Putative polyprotein [Oryza sativa Japonica Group]
MADKVRDYFINIVHQFGVPNRNITDNGTQFTVGVFKDICEDFGTKICYASVVQVERANVMVLQVYEAEAMLPSEMEFESLCVRNFNEERPEQDRANDLNRLQEAREAALI